MVRTISEQQALCACYATFDRPFVGIIATKGSDWTYRFVANFASRREAETWWEKQSPPARVYWVKGDQILIDFAR